MKDPTARLAEITPAIRAAEQHQHANNGTLNRYHANYLIALMLCWEQELKTQLREQEDERHP